PTEDPVRARIMAIVAEQTGYPAEMLDPELDLEADLGIDTVKQAEVFVAVREAYGIERDANLSLRDFNTLEKVVGFVYGRRPDLKPGVPAAAPASTLPAAPAAAPSADDEVRTRVLGIIAEQTGYPAEMLDPELDLEADLGIDTVKQAEVFVAVREAYGIERDPNLSLRDFNTINRVVEFVHARRPSNGVAVAAAEGVPVEASAAPVMQGSLQAAAAVPRRVPVSVLRLPLAVMKATGVTLAEGDRVVVMADGGPVAGALAGRLEARGVKVLRAEPTAGAEALAGQLAEWQKDGPIAGVYWLPALEDEGAVAALSLAEFTEATRRRVKLLHLTARALYEDLAGAGRFLISATRMGGAFGLDGRGVSAPLGGAVAGFTKAFARERPEALVKVVDFELDAAPDAVATALVDETMGDPGAVEIGRRGEERSTVRLQEIPVEDGQAGLTLTPDSVFLVTGAAGSITSAIVADLAAAAGGGVFYLLDLAPEPNRADPDLVAFHADPEGLKRTLFERLSAGGEKATPAKVNKLLAGIEREAAALAAVRAVEVAGGTAHYRSVNLMDHEGVQQVVAALREAHGHVDVVLHAGGLEISRFLPDKTPEEFALVFDVKAQGWYSLLSALGDMTPKATVVFSSIAGRFGNAGQADYAAANELLAKTSVALRARGVRAMVMDWTAWGGIGMATRGSIPTMMARAGIEMLPPEAGIAFIRRELTSGGRADEVVVAGALGVMLTPRDDTGGLLQEALPPGGPMVGRVMGSFVEEGLVVEVELDPSAQPFLDHHRIDGTPVLPGVMGLEAFAEVARLAFPDRVVAEVADVAFLAPFKFYRSQPRTVKVCAQFTKDGDDVIAHCVLCGERSIAGQEKPQRTLHFKGAVRLSHEAPEPADVEVPPEAAAAVVGHDSIYDVYFHGPAYRVLAEAWANGDRVAGKMAGGLGPNHAPAAAPLALSPRLVELCFQTAGVGEIGRKHTLGLPSRVARVRHYKADGESVPLFCVVRPGQAGVDAQVVDAEGRVYVELAGYETESLPVPLPESKYAPLAAALS
ncbi:MAG: SDR family NAD(P)-dependent oxidoreductase, partial [Myxococcales bacterium]|nr:SDR family NAD(P)-dependent oxidoreductase [Myxococcales bacterium]